MGISELKTYSLFKLIDIINQKRGENDPKKIDKVFNKSMLNKPDFFDNWVHVDLKKWSTEEKERLLKNTMVAIVNHHFNSIVKENYNELIGVYASETSEFDSIGFNSVLGVINGKNEIIIHRNFVDSFDEELKMKI